MHKTRIISVLFYYSNIVCILTTSISALPTPHLLNSVNSKKLYPTGKIYFVLTLALISTIDSDMPIPDLDLKFLRRILISRDKRLLVSSCLFDRLSLSVCPSACISAAFVGQTFVKLDIGDLYESLSRKPKFG